MSIWVKVDRPGKLVDLYGAVNYTEGSGASSYGFTNEYQSQGKIYLRARHYMPSIGRFLTRDTWEGNANRPMSFNRWIYGLDNPSRYKDPSGMEPCSRAHQYCQLDNPKYAGVTIDVTHLYSSWDIANQILDNLFSYRGEIGTFLVKAQGGYVIPKINRRMYQLTGKYQVDLTDVKDDNKLRRIGLGIFMDYQVIYEFVQPCFPGGFCSSYSNEDLPSDYLGYIARARNVSIDGTLNYVLGELGGGHAADEKDPIYTGSYLEGQLCKKFGICGEKSPFNRCFTFKGYDKLTGKFSYLDWPVNLQLNGGAVGPGKTWKRVGLSISVLPQP